MSTELLSRDRIIIAGALTAVIILIVIVWATLEYIKPKQEDSPPRDEDSDHLLNEEAPDPEKVDSDVDMVFSQQSTPVIVNESLCRAQDDSVLIANVTVGDSLMSANDEDEESCAVIDRLAARLSKPKIKEERDELSTQLVDLISRINETLETEES